MNVKKWCSVLLCAFLCVAAFAQAETNSAMSANRRTAIRYVQLAKQYAARKQWDEADAQARLGLAYDTLSTKPIRAALAGTKDPICAMMQIRAVWRNNADLPLIFGPVIIIICEESESSSRELAI